jgi:hypothetical protein
VRLLTADWEGFALDTPAGKCLIIQKVCHEEPVEVTREQVFAVSHDGELRVRPVSVFLVVGNWNRFMETLLKFFVKFPYEDYSPIALLL